MYQSPQRFESSTASDVLHQAKHQATEMKHRAEALVADHPGSSTLIAFGLGVAVGLAAVACLPSPRRSLMESHLPDWLSLKELARLVPQQLSR